MNDSREIIPCTLRTDSGLITQYYILVLCAHVVRGAL